MTFLALDIGTSELKITVFDSNGNSLHAIRSEVQNISDNGSHLEMDPEAFWRAVCQGIQGLGSKLALDIGAGAISSHGESFIPLDAQGKPIGNFILNIDSRATDEMAEYEASFGRERLYQKTGLPPHPMYTLPKIAWLRRHRPDRFAMAMRFLCVEDYILSRLAIEPAMSGTLASRTLGFDIQRGAWDGELLRFAGIDEQQLSRVESSGKAVGTASAKVSNELGLPADMVWCTAGHDQACASIGAGALEPGTIADGTGTFECASVPLREALVSPTSLAANLPCERHIIPDQFLTLAYVPGGIALKWLRDNFVHLPGYSYDAMLAGLPVEPTGVLCFPYFLGTGTPWLQSHARGAIYGLTSTTTQSALAQAMLEGISYEMRLNFDVLRGMGIGIEQVYATGGGARSDAWLQLKSDIFGCSVVQIPGESSSRGAAICAAMAVGEYRDWNEAVAAMVKRGRVFEPRAAVQQRYQELFDEYKQMAERIYGYKSSAAQTQIHSEERS
ncbi:MAG: hypothetical protein LAO30_12830 [Acidobacteriia bacterium]|nr:hypothetical protein [Terriglobia bacterium]